MTTQIPDDFMADFDASMAALEKQALTPDGELPAARRANPNSAHAKVYPFPCEHCRGTGTWISPLGRKRGPCSICQGRGGFMVSAADRAQKREKARVARNELREAGLAAFEAEYADVFSYLKAKANSDYPNEFCDSLWRQLNERGSLSDNQIAAVRRGLQKIADRKAEEAKFSQSIDLTSIKDMFDHVVGQGYKYPKYRAENLVLSRAGDNGRNPGALYVCDEAEQYLGKIVNGVYTGKPALGLAVIAADPRAAAVAWGKKYGRCSCCGADLTNPDSIALGIGPICAEKWGW